MFLTIILFTSIIMLICSYFSFRGAATPSQGKIFGLSLDEYYLQDSRVNKLSEKYLKSIRNLTLLCIVLHIPLIPLAGWYTSVFLTCYLAWCVLLFGGSTLLLKKSFRKLYTLKQENHWTPADPSEEYWKRGYYYNPEDQRLLAPSRSFSSFTTSTNISFNMAQPVGKALTALFWGAIAALMLWMTIFFFRMDFIPYDLRIQGEEVQITAGAYPVHFPINDIQNVQLLEDLPTHSYAKTNGAATDQYLLGKFHLKGVGSCRMYYYMEYSPVIEMTLPDYNVYFNTKDPDKTQGIYQELLSYKE